MSARLPAPGLRVVAHRAACVAIATALGLGCGDVQDLGGDRARAPDAAAPGFDPDALAQAPGGDAGVVAPSTQGLACPAHAPEDRAPCGGSVGGAVGWCSYRVDVGRALAAKCACGIDGRWVCLRVHDDDRRRRLEGEPSTTALTPLTSTACTEGAPCAGGVSCTIPQQRTCFCLSSGRLSCTPLVR